MNSNQLVSKFSLGHFGLILPYYRRRLLKKERKKKGPVRVGIALKTSFTIKFFKYFFVWERIT